MNKTKKNAFGKKLLTLISAFFTLCLSVAIIIAFGKHAVEKTDGNVLAAGEYAETYEFTTLEQFLNYSQQYAAGNRNAKDKLVFALTSGDEITNGEFISLGTANKPFAGELVISTINANVFYLYNCPLFDYVSTDMVVTGSGVINIQRYAALNNPAAGVLTSGALFANHVVKGDNAASWTVNHLPCQKENTTPATSYAGLIGDIADECTVTIDFTDTSSCAVMGTTNTGYICGTLGEDATLAVATAGSGSNRSLSTTSGHAGGLVGRMKDGSTLKYNSDNGTRINNVSTTGSYAGGIVGYAENVTFQYGTGVTTYTVSGDVSGKSGAGGLFGYYKNEVASTFNMATYTITSGMTMRSTSGPTGGIFGSFVNTAASFTFNGNASAYSVVLPSGTSRGGVCGRLQTNALTDTITVTNVVVSVSNSFSDGQQSGGLIGVFSNNPAYVSVSAVSVTSSSGTLHGGLIGNIGTGGSFVDVSGSVVVSGSCDAGLIHEIPQGVIRLQGTTDLGGFVQRGNESGTIAKNRNRALVYAPGDGKGTNGNWTLKRRLNNSIEDIAAWGQVIRADGVTLTESDLFTVNMTAHTVTVKQAYTTISNITQFALTALNIKLNTGAGVGALQFTSGNANLSSTLLAGTLTLGADIALANTGLYGLTRDDGGNAAFSGTFNGADHKITFATGKPYGLDANGDALASDSKQGNVYRHGYTGLFAKTSNATVNNLTLVGDVVIRQSKDTIRAGAFTAQASNGLTLNNLTVPTGVSGTFTLTYTASGDYTFYFGGAIGCVAGTGADIAVTGGTITPTVNDATTYNNQSNTSYHGGVIGGLLLNNVISPTQTVAFSGNTTIGIIYNKSTNSNRESAFGGAIAYIEHCYYVKGNRIVTFTNTTVNTTASGNAGANRFGGILGVNWLGADVTVTSLTVNANITALGAANYGGLVMTATGGWSIAGLNVASAAYTLNLPNNNSTFGFVANQTYSEATVRIDNTTHYPTSALYLSINNTGSNYNIGALAFTFSGTGTSFSHFDELVADSRCDGGNLTNNGNSVISVTTSDNILTTDGSAYNSYLNKTAYGRTNSGRINNQTRYYYNIDYARSQASTVDKYNFLIWSVKQYAYSTLADWFICSSTFTGTLDMTGLSYYPVDLPTSSVTFSSATLTLDNNLTEAAVKYAYRYADNGIQSSDTRTTRTNTNQHYLMHTSVFRNVTGTITINGLEIQGNVPKFSDSSCGFFISGTLGGSDSHNARLTAEDLIFNQTKIITSAGGDLSSNVYAPLFINKIGRSTTLTVAGAEQSGYTGSSTIAASSLIGDVGSDNAVAIYLTFTGLVFDGRSATANIGDMNNQYGTGKSIFSRATILNSFLYFSECSGSYNFEIDEDWDSSSLPASQKHDVTYGKEITSSTERSGLQKKYLGSEYYTSPTTYQATSEYDFSTGFLPYVYVAYDLAQYKHELAINISIDTTIEGCGKYGDPFIIDNEDKLASIANIIATNAGTGVKIYLPSNIATVLNWTSTGYNKYLYEFGTPDYTTSDAVSSDINADVVREYLTGAYYVITKDITLPYDFVGLGATNQNAALYAFRGVLIGRGNPTITNTSRNPLIKTSVGSVVQNLTVNVNVDTTNLSGTIPLSAPDGDDTYEYNGGVQYYGAVIGQILGGDNFIAAVDVDFSNVTFNLTAADSSHYVRLTPIGGYVGVIVNGGLIFRDMTASNVGLTSSTFDKVTDEGYLYVNPIIGRVIAGYAFHETTAYHATESETTLKNGLKNYTISDLTLSGGKLTISYSSSTFTVTIPDGQAMFLLGAIVNSGAASASYNGSSEQAYAAMTNTFWSAYREYTTVRGGATYSAVGAVGFGSETDYTQKATNDVYSSNRVKIPYVIRAYTINSSGSIYFARCLSSSANVRLNVTGDCDIAQGFRGIGSIYYDNDSTRLRILSMNGNDHTIDLNMRFLEYDHRSVSAYIGVTTPNNTNTTSTAGFGLFNVLKMTNAADENNDTNSIKDFVLSGSVFYDVYTTYGNQSTYLFTPFVKDDYDQGTISYSGTEEDKKNSVNQNTVLSIGGIAGFTKQYHIRNVFFNDFSVEGAQCAGGLVGYSYCQRNGNDGNSEYSYIIYTKDIPTGADGSISVVGGLRAGGLIGRIYCRNTKIIGKTGGTDILLNNIEIKTANPNETGMAYPDNLTTGAGGIIGSAWCGRGVNSTYSVNGESISVSARIMQIDNINVKNGVDNASISVRNNSDAVAKNNYAGGFIASAHGINLKVNHCTLTGIDINANTAGGVVGKLTQKYIVSLNNVTLYGKITVAGNEVSRRIKGTQYAGGFVGYFRGHDNFVFVFDGCTITGYTVEAATTDTVTAAAGGIIGYLDGDNKGVNDTSANHICSLNNITASDTVIKTNYTNGNTSCGTGGVIGTAKGSGNNKFRLTGRNILVIDCTLTHLNGSGGTDDSMAPANKKIGDIVGNNLIDTTIKFVGVSTQNDSYCGRHVGKNGSSTENYGSDVSAFGTGGGYIVFADYNNRLSNTTWASIDDSETANDNHTDVSVVAPYVTSAGTITIGGVLLTSDGVAASVATLPINNIMTAGASGKYAYAAAAYYNGSSGSNNLTVFSGYEQKLAMFTTEVSGYIGTDFPILILDDTTKENSHKMINSYLRLLTNTNFDFGVDVAGKYSVAIYNMYYSAGVFTPVYVSRVVSESVTIPEPSLKRSGGQFYMINTDFDSGKIQFSLIDVRFYDPVSGDVAYHLYVPIFVKKVLSYSFDIAAQSGTTYLSSVYSTEYGKALIENIGTPVTAYFQYTYSRTAAEWRDAIYAGENVNRNYVKRLQLYKANTNDALKNFPSDTVLVLIDPNNGGKAYYSTIGQALVGTNLNLSAFKSVMTVVNGELTFSGDSFSPVKLQKLLDLTTSGPRTTDLWETDKFVTTADENEATVYVGNQGYRLATAEELEDTTIGKYSIYTGDSTAVEKYYLSIFTESTPQNDLLFHYYYLTTPTAFDELDYPSKIIDTGAHTMVHLVMGKIFSHSDLTIASTSKSGAQMMTGDNNELNVTMTVDAGLSVELPLDIKSNLQSMIRSTEVYQGFLVYLNRKEGTLLSRAIIGNPTGSGSYTVNGGSSTAYSLSNVNVTQNYAEFVTSNLAESFATGNIFTITSAVKLTYATERDILSQFPGQGQTAPDNGVTVSCASNLAFAVNAVTTSKNSLAIDGNPAQIYYSAADPEVAVLDLNPVGDKVGDFTPLGVNGLTLDENATSADFDVLAVLDVTSVYEQLSSYEDAYIRISLQQKANDDTYGSNLDLSQYFNSLTLEGMPPETVIDNDTYYTITLDRSALSDNGAEIAIPMFHFNLKTKSSYESAGLTYGNFRISVSIVLRTTQNEEVVEIPVSRVNNYVIFTNAKVIPYFIS